MMPLAMLSQGSVSIVDHVEPATLRTLLCDGRDVTIAIVVANGLDRLTAWEEAIGVALR